MDPVDKINVDTKSIKSIGSYAKKEQTGFKVGEKELRLNQQNLGRLGSIFGSQQNAPTNIAALVALISMLILIFMAFSSGSQLKSTEIISVLSSALGFLFGRSSK